MKVNIKNTKNTMDINLQVKHKNKTRELTKVACMAALICVASFVYIPLPFTEARISLMPFMVELVGLILSPVQAGVSILVYLIIGICWGWGLRQDSWAVWWLLLGVCSGSSCRFFM